MSFVLADAARACSCVQSLTIDIVVERTQNIALFKLQAVEKYAEGERGYGSIKQARLVVEKVYKGNLKVGEEYIFGQGSGTTCTWAFSGEGIGTHSFLFYLGEKPKPGRNWWASYCSRSGASDLLAADFLYLEKLAEVKGKTRLSGSLWQYVRAAVKGETSKRDWLAGRKIRVIGSERNIELKTDDNGAFEIYDLPAGKYNVVPEPIAGYKFNDEKKDSVEVEIKAKSHAEIIFRYEIDNARGNSVEEIETPPIQIEAVSDLSGIESLFPFQSCKKAKIK